MANSNSNSSAEDFGDDRREKRTVNRKIVFIVAVCLVLIGLWQQDQNKPQQPPQQGNEIKRDRTESPAETENSSPDRDDQLPSVRNQSAPTPRIEPRENDEPKDEFNDPTKIPDVTVRDPKGNVIFHGTVDLQPTLDRIEARQKLPYQHDGIVFQNREGHLPKKPAGYYFEYVHLTPKHSGPGPQRVVIGKSGEVYYTHDHYRTFQRIRWK